MLKKLIITIVVLVVIGGIVSSCNKGTTPTSSSNPKTESTTTKTFTIQDIAKDNGLTIGELNKIYRLDTKYKYSNGSYMIVNFQSVKATKQFKDFKNVILVENVLPLKETREMFDQAGFFTLYDESGKEYSDVSVTTGNLDDGNTGIVVYNDKTDLTKYKYISFGPIDRVRQILFPIQ